MYHVDSSMTSRYPHIQRLKQILSYNFIPQAMQIIFSAYSGIPLGQWFSMLGNPGVLGLQLPEAFTT